MITKKRIRLALICAAIVLLIVSAATLGVLIFRGRYIAINGEYYPRSSKSLDLRGTELTAEQYYELRAELPDCELLWSVPFQGEHYPNDTEEITISSLATEEVQQLDLLPKLRAVHADGCEDYEALVQLRERRPECRVDYTVTIGGLDTSGSVTALELEAPDWSELMERLAYLPELTELSITNPGVHAERMLELRDKYPSVNLSWRVVFGGMEFPMECTQADISDVAVDDLSVVEREFACLPELESLLMNNCNKDNEAMAALRERVRADYKVVWTVKCGQIKVRTDETTFMPARDHIMYYGDKEFYNLRYCEDMVCVDVGHMLNRSIEWVEFMPHLKYLVISISRVKDFTPLSSCKELIFLEMSDIEFAQLEPLLGCTALQDLNLGHSRGDHRIIAKMTWLKNIWWVGLNENGARYIREANPDARVHTVGPRTVDGGWRKLQNYYDMRDLLGMYYLN